MPESGSMESSRSIRGMAKKAGIHRSGRHQRLICIPMWNTTSSPSWRWVMRPVMTFDMMTPLDWIASLSIMDSATIEVKRWP